MVRFLAYSLFATALAIAGADLMHFWNHGAWSWYTVGSLVAQHGITVDSLTAPLTHELIEWMRPAPLGILAGSAAVIAWMMQPRYFPKVIADFA